MLRAAAGEPEAPGGAPPGALAVAARVVEALPNALYRLELEDGRRAPVLAHAAGSGLLRLLPGDRVVVELMPYDAGRGRIVRRRV